jgi:hypothetical protein
MRAMPDSGDSIESSYDTRSPRLDFEVSFVKTGTHYVWIRYLRTGGQDDSCHVGIDGKEGADAENMSAPGPNNAWNWNNQRIANLGPAKLEVTSAGVHTVNVWMREDGFRLDKIVLTTDESYTPTDESPEESPLDGIVSSKVGPNEPEPIEVPLAAQPAPDRAGLRRNAFDIGPEVYSFKYEEPGLMEETGVFYGVVLGYTHHSLVPASPEESPVLGRAGAMYRVEGRLAYGEVDYDGQYQDGTPLTIEDVDDRSLEIRSLFGADVLGGNTLNTIYAGIGYRYLNDDLSVHPGGYERESNYVYLPIGYMFDSTCKAGWSFGFNVEYDIFLWGNQRSHLSDVGLRDVDNRQESGYGYRASVKIQYKHKRGILVIEPFFRYWDIDDSEVENRSWGSVWEPANETMEWGLRLSWMF